MERQMHEGAFAPSVLAWQTVGSPRFVASGFETERQKITAECMMELDAFALVAYLRTYVVGGQPEAGEVLPIAVGHAWEQSLEELERGLQLQVAGSVIEALELCGVTDEGTKAEICRIVIKGGELFDGKGFMEGRPVSPAAPRKAAGRAGAKARRRRAA